MQSEKLFEIQGTNRKAIIRKSPYVKGIVVDFYYDGFPDYEWKRGSAGIACDICETLEQAKAKAKYYVKKDKIS